MAAARHASRSRFTLVLLILTTVTLLTLDLRGFEPVDDARDATMEALAPVRDGVGSALDPVGDAWDGALGYDELEAENEELRERIAELEGELALTADAKVTLERLQDELDLDYIGDIEPLLAPVVGGGTSNFDHVIEIDRGSSDGVQVGMPVVSRAGLVGSVETVSDSRAVVRLISDPAFRVGVRLSETEPEQIGVARGQGRGRPLIVFQGVDADAEVEEGMQVLTSGLERSLFPGRIPIGTVTSTATSPGELDQDLLVEPLASLDSLTFVNVLLWVPEEGP